MAKFFRRFTKRFLLIFNIALAALFLITCLTPYLNPAHWWFIGFLSLGFPFLFLLILLFFFLWLLIKPAYCWIPLLALVIGYKNIGSFLAINWHTGFHIEKAGHHLRIMTWNVSRFIPMNANSFPRSMQPNLDEIRKEIKKYEPDVLCFQEFYSSLQPGNEDNIRLFQEEMGYPYFIIARDVNIRQRYAGTAIFSRFPFTDTGRMKFPADLDSKRTESLLWADLIMNDRDTVRITTLHLQSFNFKYRDYKQLSLITNQEDSGFVASKNIMRKMKEAFSFRGQQADYVQPLLNSSPYPQVICGDFNDVPNSYTYFTMRANRRDAFLEKGIGLGKTYSSNYSGLLRSLPTLRIDYILADRVFRISQYKNNQRLLSDHFAQIADLELQKKIGVHL